jgi:hypothetical protein
VDSSTNHGSQNPSLGLFVQPAPIIVNWSLNSVLSLMPEEGHLKSVQVGPQSGEGVSMSAGNEQPVPVGGGVHMQKEY